ncbi:Asp-tRNA(Asn)/Glu-tRNA(Gln) amidotransferase subunit GatB [Candidatus Woesearchaeota archaeon]|nr:Asp-tRNA(Asn)/Glu-tRNA(Gln) amidotransferase subunit GatB [Candidatus Woesearchaeota archaeon]
MTNAKQFASDVIIGLEIHVQLNTKTKLFCGCSTQGSEEPNTRTCDVCLGFPGSKPVLNKAALDAGLRLALALGCTISPKLIFSRKSYFYPDLAKNYQISQHELPLGAGGKLALNDGTLVHITRAHLEEDPASLIHQGSAGQGYVLIDYNRSGNPLCEIVTAPDMRGAEQAREFLNRLVSVLEYLEIFDLGSCIIKADANVSIAESGYIRAEIKNITGFKEIERALTFEVERQKLAVQRGERLVQETRGWDPAAGVTSALRLKETEADYGYILDPDLVSVDITNNMVKDAQANLPELPAAKTKRFVEQYQVKFEDAMILAAERSLAHLFETVAKKFDSSFAVRWLRHELSAVLNAKQTTWSAAGLDERLLLELFELVQSRTVTDLTARDLLQKLFERPFSPKEYVAKHKLASISDRGELEKIAKKIVDENPQAAEDVKSGESKALNFLIGKVMHQTKGKADAGVARQLIMKILER